MSCPDEMTQMLFTDGELEAESAAAVVEHLRECLACRRAVQGWRDEASMLRTALDEPDAVHEPAPWLAPLPAASMASPAVGSASLHPANWMAGLATAAVASACWFSLSPTLPGYDGVFALVGGLAVSHLLDNVSSIVTYGVDMIASFTIGLLALALGAWVVAVRGTAVRAAALGIAVFAWSSSASAAEFRSGDRVVVEAGEVVSATMFASAKTVEIDGRVDGDLFVVGGRVVIRGHIDGNVTAATEDFELEGTVTGAVHWGGKSIRVPGKVGANAYLFGESMGLDATGEVGRDVFAFGKRWRHDGTVGRDLKVYAKSTAVAGSVARDAHFSVHDGELADGSRVGGDLTALTDKADAMHIDAGAVVEGEQTFDIRETPEIRVEVERYARAGHYAWELAGVIASFFVGLLLFVVAPRLFVRRVDDTAWLRLAGTGFLLLVVPPVAGIVLLLTVIGIPMGVMVLGAYGLAVYLAQIVAAGYVALRVLKREPTRTTEFAPAMGLGVVALALLSAIPFIGGWVSFASLLVGLGILYAAVSAAIRERSVA